MSELIRLLRLPGERDVRSLAPDDPAIQHFRADDQRAIHGASTLDSMWKKKAGPPKGPGLSVYGRTPPTG